MNQVTGGTKTKQWIYTATTNKAVHSLKQATQCEEVRTVHSLLGLRIRNDYKTGQTFISQIRDAELIEESIIMKQALHKRSCLGIFRGVLLRPTFLIMMLLFPKLAPQRILLPLPVTSRRQKMETWIM